MAVVLTVIITATFLLFHTAGVLFLINQSPGGLSPLEGLPDDAAASLRCVGARATQQVWSFCSTGGHISEFFSSLQRVGARVTDQVWSFWLHSR